MQKLFTLLILFCSIGFYAFKPPLKTARHQQEKVADQPTFSCAMPAYLLQGSPTDAYAVNLSTGETTLVKNNLIGPNMGGRQIQAVGYNVLDNYLWGYRSGTDQLVRIGGDWSVQFFTISGLVAGSYDVGDIDANGIMYLSTGSSTIKRIDLNASSPTYLQTLSDLTTTGTTIADWSVNVVDGNIYAINQSSLLLRYNTTTGVRTTLGVIQWSVPTGTGFGAAYSDNEGNLYVQDNQGGKIFKIDKPHLLPASTTAQINGNLFANTGLTTSSNDGTRCMNAPPPCQAPVRPDGMVTQPGCLTTTGTLSLTAPTGADIQYNINGGAYQVSPQFTGLLPGSYTVTARNVLTSCLSAAVTFTITAIPAPPATPVVSVADPTCSVSTGTITVTAPASGVTYSFDNGVTYQSANAKSGLPAGVYVVKVRSTASGCASGPVSATVAAAPDLPATPVVSVTDPTCSVSTGTITVNTPASGVTYSFDNGVTYQSANAKSGLPAGVYVVKVRSTASGCASGPVSATVAAAPAVPVTPVVSVTDPTCSVSTGTITVNTPASGVTYSFDNGATYQSGNVRSGLSAGVYQIKVRSTVSGCESGPVSATVATAPDLPVTPVVSVTDPTCSVSTGTITVNTPASGVDYSFDNGSTYQSGNVRNGLAAGVYQIKVRSTVSGCESGPVSATVAAAPDLPATPVVSVADPTCSVSTGRLTVTAPASGVTYSFDNGATYQSANAKSGLPAGVYAVKVRSTASGCESGPVRATVAAAPDLPVTPVVSVTDPTCSVSTGTITVNTPASGVTYSFDNGATYQSGNVRNGLAAGVYQIKVRSTVSGCESGPVSATVATAPAVPVTPVVSVTDPTCSVSTGTITVNTPASGVAYSFDNGATYQSGNVRSGLAAGVYQIKVRSTASGCESGPVSATVAVAPAVPVTPVVSVVDPTCLVSTGTLTVMFPASGVTYSFDNGSTYQSANVRSGLSAGVYVVKVRSTASGCESGPVSATVAVAPAVPATPVVSVVDPTCLVSTGTLTVMFPASGVTYSFDNGSTYQSANVRSGLSAGVYVVKVRSTASGCESGPVSATVAVAPAVPATPVVSVADPTCSVSTGTITVTTPASGVTYSFDNGSTYQSANAKNGLSAGVYQIKVRSTASGCESGPVSATVAAAPTVPVVPTVSVTDPTCLASTGTITVNTPSSGVTYSFDNGSTYQSSNFRSGLAAGVYQIKVRSMVSGCESGPVSATVAAAPTVPVVPTVSVTDPTCLASTGTITVNTPSSGVTYSFDNGSTYQSANVRSGLSAGVYQIKVRSTASGCASGPVSATVAAAPDLPAVPVVSVVDPTCSVSTGRLTVTAPASGVTYSFDNGVTYQSANAKSDLPAGVYVVKVRSTASGCESGPVSATVAAAPAVPVTPVVSVTDPTCSVSTGTLTVNTPASGVTYSFDNGSTYQSGNVRNGLAAGVYQIKVRSTVSGCESGPVSATVAAAPDLPAVPVVSVVDPTCLVSTGRLTVNTPASGVTYSFDNGSTYQSANVRSGLSAGVYAVKARSMVSGCESGPVRATVAAAPDLPVTPVVSVTDPTCSVSTGTITVNTPASGVDYSFDNGSTYQSGNVRSGLAAGVYQIKVRSMVSGCESGPVSATVAAAPDLPAVPVVSVVDPTCSVSTGRLTVTAPASGVTYSFDNGATYQSGNVRSGLAAGVYQIKVRSTASGCESGPVSATVAAAPDLPAVPVVSVVDPTCSVSTGRLTVNTPASGVTYSFDNGSTYQSGNFRSGLSAGVYQIKVRSTASGCESGPVSATVAAAPAVPVTPVVSVTDPTCSVSTGTLTVNTPASGVTYSFDNGSTYQSGNVRNGLAAGVYQIKVRSTVSGCESGPVSATVATAPDLSAMPVVSVADPTCLVSTGTLTVNTPASGVTYSFDNGSTYQSANAKNGLSAGVYQIKVRSTASGCESGPVSATVAAAPAVPVTPVVSVTDPTCSVSTGTLTVNTPASGVTYSFDNGSTYQSGNVRSGLAAGVYQIKVRSTVSGCESGPVSATVAAAPAVPVTPVVSVADPTCSVSTGTITVNTPASGVAYSFDNGSTYQSANVRSGLSAGVYAVKVRSTASGCESGPVSATVAAAPDLPATPVVSVTDPTCSVSTGTLTVNTPASGVTYSFDNGSTYQSGNVRSGLAAGVYQIKVRSTASGCESGPVSATVAAALTVPATPVVSVVDPTCSVSTGTLTVTAPASGVTYSFDNGSTYQSGNVKSGLSVGVYQIKVRSTVSGCESGPVRATVAAAPDLPVTPVVSVTDPTCSVSTGTITVNTPASGVDYSFDNGSTYQSGNVRSGLAAGVYVLKVRSTASGCESGPVSATVAAAPAVPATPVVSVTDPTCLTLTGSVNVLSPSTNVWYSFNGGVDYQDSSLKNSISPGTQLTILVKNKESGCLSTALSMTIHDPGNCPPVANPNAGTALLGGSLTGNLLADDLDPEGGRLLVSQITINGETYTLNSGEPVWLTIPAIGTLVVSNNGVFTFLPAPKFTGPVPVIGYVVSDEAGATASSTLRLLVEQVRLQAVAPVYDCMTGTLSVKTTGGDGTPVEWRAIGLTDWTSNLTGTVPEGLRNDPKTIILFVRQSGFETSYTFDMVAACGDCSPGQGKPLRLKTPVLNCKESTVCLPVCGGDGSEIRYRIDNVSGWNTEACVMVGDDLVHRDPKILFIRVQQKGQEQVFEYNLPLASAACPDSTRPWNQRIPITPPPPSVTMTIPGSPTGTTGQPIALLEPLYSCATGVITFRYQGGDGSPVEFMAVGITGWTTLPIHHVEEALWLEQPPVLIYARQNNTLVTYSFDLKGYCQKTLVPPPPSTTIVQPNSPVSLTLLPPVYDCRTDSLWFTSTGGDGSPVEFMAVGITGWTTRKEHVLDAAIRQNGEWVRIFARQQGVMTSLLWNPAQACQPAGRRAVTDSRLQVMLLENPVPTDQAILLLTGSAPAKPVTVLCHDSQGRFVSRSVVNLGSESVKVPVSLGQTAGIYLISIMTDGYYVQVKAVKP